MNIEFIDIQNFRKLKKCRIDISKKETVFVGANNSGKTTAMEALIKFLKKRKSFSTRDFTLSNWIEINNIGTKWINETDYNKQDLNINNWEEHLPSLDVWLKVEKNEIHYVSNLIPTLDWDGGLLGVRLRFEPNNIEELFKEFKSIYNNSKKIVGDKKIELWPKDLWQFLDNKGNLNKLFSVKTYLLNPSLKNETQKLSESSITIDSDVFKGVIRVDIINAQRGFTDENSEGEESSNIKNLSNQLKGYYDKHLNQTENPTEDDIDALSSINNAKNIFDNNINVIFEPSLTELEDLNYPGFGNPKIKLESKLNTVDSLNHSSAVRYELSSISKELTLPENYNGLGYQNLISMIFKLIAFRDEWMQVGKNYKSESKENSNNEFEPIHLVLIEEPEAHLHAQVQQVFIKKAYDVLRKNENLKGNNHFTSQLVISTHSNHVAHEIDFTSLRYFKRVNGSENQISTSSVENLSETFGKDDDTTKFATRYLKTTHCDLFFADAVILVEGPVERMLIPHFIKHNHKKLSSCYISILEIGGSHAHTLKPLIEQLGIVTLIITDLDSILGKSKVQPDKLKKYKTNNDVLKSWIPEIVELDKLLDLPLKSKQHKKYPIQVAYQIPIKICIKTDNQNDDQIEVYPYTFEDSLVMENREVFKKIEKSSGLLKKMADAASETNIKLSAKNMYVAITADGAKKAEFALGLLYMEDPNVLTVPKYINEGLEWLENELITKKDGLNHK